MCWITRTPLRSERGRGACANPAPPHAPYRSRGPSALGFHHHTDRFENIPDVLSGHAVPLKLDRGSPQPTPNKPFDDVLGGQGQILMVTHVSPSSGGAA